MSKLNIDEYLKLLKFSKNQIIKYEKLYNKNLYKKSVKLNKLKLRYNLFTYTQLTYALKNFLLESLEEKDPKIKKISSFFNKNPIIIIGNIWKHKGISFHQNFIIKFNEKIIVETGTEIKKTNKISFKINKFHEELNKFLNAK